MLFSYHFCQSFVFFNFFFISACVWRKKADSNVFHYMNMYVFQCLNFREKSNVWSKFNWTWLSSKLNLTQCLAPRKISLIKIKFSRVYYHIWIEEKLKKVQNIYCCWSVSIVCVSFFFSFWLFTWKLFLVRLYMTYIYVWWAELHFFWEYLCRLVSLVSVVVE